MNINDFAFSRSTSPEVERERNTVYIIKSEKQTVKITIL